MIKKQVVLFLTILLASCNNDDIWKQQQLDQRLLEATAEGQAAIVDSCLQKGADIEARNIEGATPLITAAVKGHDQVVATLLKAGANADARRMGYYGSTALMEASVRNDTSIAQILLQNGADIHLRDTFGDPAINWAAYYGQLPYVDILVRNGASWETESAHGTAIDIAAKEWKLDVYEYFIKQGAGEKSDLIVMSAINAVKAGDSLKVEQLLENGNLDPDQKAPLGMPVLIWAAAKGYPAITRLLIEHRANVNAKERTGQTALAAAARFGQVDIVKQLIAAGADVNLAGEKYGLTPLINAAISGNVLIGELLLENGAEIDHQDTLVGYSALMYAVANRHREFIALLIRNEANPYIKGHDGTGLYELIGLSGDEYIAKMLEAYILKRQ